MSDFDARAIASARAEVGAGIPFNRVGLPYLGPPAQVIGGIVVPGPLLAGPSEAEPQGIAYYGESDPAGTILATTVETSTVVGALDVNSLNATSIDSETPDVWGVQLNAILTGVVLQGDDGYEFWLQNAIDYMDHNSTLTIGSNAWNVSESRASVPNGTETISSLSRDGTIAGGVYEGLGPYLPAPCPFTLVLYLNTSRTANGNQEEWFNYTLDAAGQPTRGGNYDWLIFNSSNRQHPGAVGPAAFLASGTATNPIGIPYDFELDFGIGGYNGLNALDLSGNLSATLGYCPSANSPCEPGQLRSVPAAEDFGSQTGETGVGLSITFEGTTAFASSGPAMPRGLWGYAGQGCTPGAKVVANRLSTSGEPDRSASVPYIFVFFGFAGSSAVYWAPDVPTWHLMAGNYSYVAMLADHSTESGNLSVLATSTSLGSVLAFTAEAGVYTPLWAFGDSELPGVSSSGDGTILDPYQLVNNPTTDCPSCEGGVMNQLAAAFASYNDLGYPTFPGILLDGTAAYTLVLRPVPFMVFNDSFSFPLGGEATANFPFDLPLVFDHTSHVTLANATGIGSWPDLFEMMMPVFAAAATDPFPQADVTFWYSTSDLVMSNQFQADTIPICGFWTCPGPLQCWINCTAPAELLMYGGSNNTIWGNTFSDPLGTILESGANATFAGLAMAESGDWIYNNNFSIDNPVVLLPFDLYNDSCWVSLAGLCGPETEPLYSDSWNVTNQSALNAARVVNGFPLRGNVLGPGYALQGGNYWWDWGNPNNPYGTLPFVNDFDYSVASPDFPPGLGGLEGSIRVGGDFAPLRLGYVGAAWPVTFEETGLPNGTRWSITVNGLAEYSVGKAITLLEPNGSYGYTVGRLPGWWVVPGSGEIRVLAGGVTVSIAFAPVKYLLTIEELGLPSNTSWSVGIGPIVNTTLAPRPAQFELGNGTYVYTIEDVPGYTTAPRSGRVTLNGSGSSIVVRWSPVLYAVSFLELGLPNGTLWSVTLAGTANSSRTATISFLEPNGTAAYSVIAPSGYATADATSGSLRVDGADVSIPVVFTVAPPSSAATILGSLDARLAAVVGGAAVVAVGIAVVAHRRRHQPGGSTRRRRATLR